MKKPVSFYSEGCRLVGDVYYPDGPAGMRPRAGIVLGHGYTGRHRESHGCIIWSRATIRKFEAELAYLGIMTPGEITLNVVRNDPADNRYLECALEGAADYVVSGDQDLLDLHEHNGIRIVRPRVFLETLRSHHRPASQED